MASTHATSDEALIRASMEARIHAVRAKDVDGVMANYAPDVATFDLVMPLGNVGSESVRKRLGEWFSSFETAIDYELGDVHLAVAGDVAFDHHLTKVHGVNRSGQTIAMWFRETVGYRKIDGVWKITHQHSSVPIDMTNGKGRMDLTP